MAQTHIQTHGHGDSMTESAQWGRFSGQCWTVQGSAGQCWTVLDSAGQCRAVQGSAIHHDEQCEEENEEGGHDQPHVLAKQDHQRMMGDTMFMIVQNLRLFLTAVASTVVIL